MSMTPISVTNLRADDGRPAGPAAGLRSFEIWLERHADLGTGPVQQHSYIGLLNPQNVTHFLRGTALDVTQDQYQPLVLGQRCDGVLEVLACLAGQEPMLRRGSQVLLRMGPMARLGRMVGGPEAVRGDGGLRHVHVTVEASERHHPSFAGGAGLRAVDEDAKDPGLERRPALERPDPLNHPEPGVLHNLVRDSAIGDVEAGDSAEARVMLVDEARERALVASAQRVDHSPIVGRHDLRGA